MFFGEALQAVPFKVIPLLGEMSATQTKGCPFLEETVAHESVTEGSNHKTS